MYNIYAIVILILFDIPRISVNDLHQIQVAAPSPSSRRLFHTFTWLLSGNFSDIHIRMHTDTKDVFIALFMAFL